jgi:hypothetical protein
VTDIAIILTCHEPYLKYLPEAMKSINRQAPGAAECVVACDGCRPPPLPDDRWRMIQGDWRHPSLARNAGLALTTSPWVIFWDADNVMTDGYVGAAQQGITNATVSTGIIYPDIYFCDEHLAPQSLWIMPQWDYWEMRRQNCVDTASVWRRDAIEMAGGWSLRAGAFEDHALALDLTALGWKAAKLAGPPVMMRVHFDGRIQEQSREGKSAHASWEARTLAIVTLLAGRSRSFDCWKTFLLNGELPPKTALYVVDNSGDSEFCRRAFDECQRIATERSLTHLDFVSVGRPYRGDPAEGYLTRERHQHVARLYASVLPRVTEDTLMTLEDDIEAPLNAARRLGEEIGYGSAARIGAVAATYAMPHNESQVCVGDGRDYGWGSTMRWEDVPDGPIDVGCVGGGCTVWANWALRSVPVYLRWQQLLGWDAVACTEMRRSGYQVRLHGGVRCHHHIHGSLRMAPA